MDNEYKFVYDGTLWNVYQGEPTEFTLNTIEITLNVGFDTLIDYTLGPSGTYGLPIFTSKDPAIASVDAYGRVTGIAEGETTISVSFKDEVKEVKVKVEPAKEIASVYLTDCPEKYYILKGSSNTFNPILTKGRFIFTDGSYGAVVDFAREGSTLEVVDTLDVNTAGTQILNAKVKNYRGNDYNTTITVEVYEYTDQTVDVTAIVDWFNYYVFLQFPSTSNNTKANFTGTQKETEVVSGKTVVELLKDQGSYISYTRQDGTKVNLNTPYQLQSNVLVIPEFCDEKLDENGKVIHEKANAENYNTKGYYEEGDVITVKKGMPLYRWTGSVGATDADFIENSGQIIIDGYTSEDQVFVFKNNNWALFKEYTDIQLNTPTMSIEVGKTQLIDVKRVPNDATQGTFSFVSSDESVATVSSTGVVKGIGEGTATITITLEDPDHPEKKKTATCTVTVTKSSKEDPKPNEKKGCGGEIITTSAVLASLGLIGAAIGFSYLGKKKKEEDK